MKSPPTDFKKIRQGWREAKGLKPVPCPEFMAWAHATQPCAVRNRRAEAPCKGRKTFHHVREYGSPKDDRRGFILCEGHHQEAWGKYSIEKMGKPKFQEFFSINIEDEIARYNREFEERAA